MRQDLLEVVAQVINRHSFWVKVSSLRHHQPYFERMGGKVHQTTCRCMTLEVIRGRGQYTLGHHWQIPEPELDRAYSAIRGEDAEFQKRCKAMEPTPKDVEQLIKRATYGVITLDLYDDDDYTPIINLS